MMRQICVLLLGFTTAACSTPELAEPPQPKPTMSPERPPAAASLDPSVWNGRCVIARGHAQSHKIGPHLHLGDLELGVSFEGSEDRRWDDEYVGALVEVRGRVVERSDLPVFVPDPEAPVIQGMPVAPGTDLEQARKRWVIEGATVVLLRTPAQVEARLEADESLGLRAC